MPYGYRNEDKQLFIDEQEATNVQLIFDLYLKHENVRLVKEALDRRNIVSKCRVNKQGNATGGKPFTRGNINSILTNPIYIGRLSHKGKLSDGKHDAIIKRVLWEEVQALLA